MHDGYCRRSHVLRQGGWSMNPSLHGISPIPPANPQTATSPAQTCSSNGPMTSADAGTVSELATVQRLEHELRTAQLRYRQLFEAFDDGVLLLDATTGRIEQVNEVMLNLLGRAREDLAEKLFWEVDAFAALAADPQGFAELSAQSITRRQAVPLAAHGGRRLEVNWMSRACVITGRRMLYCRVCNVTGQGAGEEWLRLLAATLEHSRDSIVITDAQLDRPGPHILFTNLAFTKNTGYAPEEALGKTPRILQGPRTDRALLDRLRATLGRGEVFQGEGVNYRKDGSEFYMDWEIVPLRSPAGTVTHYAAFQRDVTERKRAAQVLAESEERYRLLVECSPDAMFVHAGGRVVFANAATAKLLGAETPDQIVGRALLDIAPPAPDRGTRQFEAPAEEVALLSEQSLRRIDGTQVKVESIGIPITFGGKPAVQMILHDLTERLRLEEQFHQAQRLESLGMLAAGIAHDLNNVLAPILMGAPLLRETTTDAVNRALLTDIEKSADRGAGLVRQILGFAHGIGGEPQTIQVNHLLMDIVSVLNRTFPKSITIDLRAPKDLWPVTANPTQVHQVLLNLSVNARDAMPQGGQLGLRAENCALDESAASAFPGARAGRWVVLHVEDTGTGIPADVLARMWDPFFTTKAANKGTGLGLSTVRGIVEAHHGFILVQTAAGRGTTFRVYLPPAERVLRENLPTPVVPRGQGELVLVVDDVTSIRGLAETILTRQGYRVLLAADGTDALEKFIRTPGIAVVVTDLDMPGLAGSALAGIVRRLNPAVKILAMSGLDAAPTDPFQPRQFADAFLLKPFTAEQILTLTHHLLHPAV